MRLLPAVQSPLFPRPLPAPLGAWPQNRPAPAPNTSSGSPRSPQSLKHLSIGWFKGKIVRNIPYFMGKSMVSCRFSPKSTH